MAEFILTWNPTRWSMLDRDYDDFADQTGRGHEVEDRWSTGSRTGGIQPGDHAYLLRQKADRGIIAQGRFVTGVYEDEHWDGSGTDANYAEVAWSVWLPVHERLPTEILKAKVPGVVWDRIQGSGVRVDEAAAHGLDDLWLEHLAQVGRAPAWSPDQVPPSAAYREGAVERVQVNRYERDPRARAAAVEHHGVDCIVCGFNFEAVYGDLGRGFINIHHVREISTLPDGYVVDPTTDLVPVCPNCHAMLHRERPAMTPEQLRQELHR